MKEHNINQMEIKDVSKKNRFLSIIESLLFVSGDALNIKEIASIIDCSREYTKQLLENLQNEYKNDDRGIMLRRINDDYSLVTKSYNSDYVQKLLKTNTRQGLSKAALETMAIIVYRQPITRIEIDEIRGVKSDKAIQKLVEKELVKETGRKNVPGRPIMYGTTDTFLKYFGLHDLKEMPILDEFLEDYSEVAMEKNTNIEEE